MHVVCPAPFCDLIINEEHPAVASAQGEEYSWDDLWWVSRGGAESLAEHFLKLNFFVKHHLKDPDGEVWI